jgi:ketosteroid isomerase-like protein
MKKLLYLILFASINLHAQSIQKEINEQVWKPFIASYNSLDTDGFMAVHSKDVIRAAREEGHVMSHEEYKKVMSSGNQYFKDNKSDRKLELRFIERWASTELAYEVGIYKATTSKPSGNNTISYGKFHVTLRKEAGVWKIVVDADSSEGATISDKEFLSARPME